MSWTTPRTFVTSEVETAAFFNAQISQNQNALIIGARAYNQSYNNVIGVAQGTTGTVSFDGVLYDSAGMWSSGSPTKLTVPIAGWYRFRGVVSGFISSPSTGFTAKLFKNGSAVVTGVNITAFGISASTVGEYDVQCSAGDFLELKVVVGAGGTGLGYTSTFSDPTTSIIAFGIFSVADLEVEWVSP